MRQAIDDLFKATTGHDLNENKDLDKIIASKTQNDVLQAGTYKDAFGNEKRYGYIDSGQKDCIVPLNYYFNNFNISIKEVIELIKEKFIIN